MRKRWKMTVGTGAATAALLLTTAVPAGGAPREVAEGAAGPTAAEAPTSAAVAAQKRFTRSQLKRNTRITSDDFGVHHSSNVKPGVPAGSLRENCQPTWREMNPRKGKYNWAKADEFIGLARSFGIKDRMFVFCGTPRWAGRNVKSPADEVRGPRSTSAPKRMKDYQRFVTKFVRKYRGDFDAYQSWNEITSKQFWQGTPRQAATMTAILRKVVKKYDPKAKVVSASVQTHKPWLHDPTARGYFSQLKRKKWPVDVIAVHGYAAGPVKNVTNQRVKQVRRMQGILDRYNPPSRIKMWDTEVNYEAPGNGNPQGRIKGQRAGAFLARTFLDSFRLGLDRTYWYLWKTEYYEFPSIQLRPGDPATRTYNRLGRWLIGTKYWGCKTKRGIATCTFKPNGKPAFKMVWANTGKKTYTTTKTKTFCKVTGGKCKKTKRYRLTETPVRVA